jgi:hypothetical protein
VQVQLSQQEGNALSVLDDGLFVAVPSIPLVPEFVLEKQTEVAAGLNAVYNLKRIAGGQESYVGDPIEIPAYSVLQGGTLETVQIDGQPYEGAKAGDPYLDLVLSDTENQHIYVPAKGLVDIYLPGSGIAISNNVVSIELDEANANGLTLTDSGLGLALATEDSPGAMSAADKRALDNVADWSDVSDQVDELQDTLDDIKSALTWQEM